MKDFLKALFALAMMAFHIKLFTYATTDIDYAILGGLATGVFYWLLWTAFQYSANREKPKKVTMIPVTVVIDYLVALDKLGRIHNHPLAAARNQPQMYADLNAAKVALIAACYRADPNQDAVDPLIKR